MGKACCGRVLNLGYPFPIILFAHKDNESPRGSVAQTVVT